MDKSNPGPIPEDKSSCDPSLSRKKFLELAIKRGALAGAILSAPKIVDKFLIPPVHAMMYTGVMDSGVSDTTGGGTDAT